MQRTTSSFVCVVRLVHATWNLNVRAIRNTLLKVQTEKNGLNARDALIPNSAVHILTVF
jgi:hypothetical protein